MFLSNFYSFIGLYVYIRLGFCKTIMFLKKLIKYVLSIYVCRTYHVRYLHDFHCILFILCNCLNETSDIRKVMIHRILRTYKAFVLDLQFKNTIEYYYHGIQCDGYTYNVGHNDEMICNILLKLLLYCLTRKHSIVNNT